MVCVRACERACVCVCSYAAMGVANKRKCGNDNIMPEDMLDCQIFKPHKKEINFNFVTRAVISK